MTDPDETQPHTLPDTRSEDGFGTDTARDDAATPDPPPSGEAFQPAGVPPRSSGLPPGPSGAPPYDPAAAPRPAATPSSDRPLTVDPDRPADPGWREPPWIPARARARDRRPNVAALVVGLVLIGLGLYWFVDRTLGIALPRISWGSLWPIVLIVIGGLILVRSLDRRS